VTLSAAALVAALYACAGGGSPDPQQNLICVTSAPPTEILYPASGATVPDGNFTLLLGNPDSPVSLAINGTVAVANLQPAPVPSPLPSPFTGDTSAAGYAVPSLQPKTTYQVMAPVPRSGCYDPANVPPQAIGTLGTFTTQ
jgi:hypothetical protein